MPSSPSKGLAAGLRHFKAREWEQALEAIDGLATEAADGPNEARVLRAACLARLHRVEEARALIDAAAAQESKDWFAVYLAGVVRLIQDDPEGARERFHEALRRFPVAGELWYHIGLAELLAGDAAAARRAFEQVAGLDEVVIASRLKRAQECSA
ncbi:MAG: tetratricopeptide repeat protein [Planctomycetota bacterium]|jgi:tetratricopeptide (TPR) repeat protein